MPAKPRQFILYAALATWILMTSACTSPRLERDLKDMPVGAAYMPRNVFSAGPLPATLRRVVVLPYHTSPSASCDAAELRDAMMPLLISSGRFEAITLDPSELLSIAGQETFAVAEGLPLSLTGYLIERFKADGVILTDVTACRPYKPLLLGLRCRLLTLPEQEVLWACDEVFDAGVEEVSIAARRYAEERIEQEYPLQRSYSALISPRRFAAYAAHAIYQTLPGREIENSPSQNPR